MSRRGISPIVAVVLLIAISVIAAVGLYFWVGTLTSKHATPHAPTVIEATGTGSGQVILTNLGQTTINLSSLRTETNGTRLSCSGSLAPGQQKICIIEGYPSDNQVIIMGNKAVPIIIKSKTLYSSVPETWFNYYPMGVAGSGQNLFVYDGKLFVTADVNTSKYYFPAIIVLDQSGKVKEGEYYYTDGTTLQNGAHSSVLSNGTITMGVYNSTEAGIIQVNLTNLTNVWGVMVSRLNDYHFPDMIETSDGNFVLVGYNGTNGIAIKIRFSKTAPKVVWAYTFPDIFNIMGVIESDTGYIITGTESGTNKNIIAIKLDKSTGRVLSEYTYDSGGYDIGRWITKDNKGNMYISGIVSGKAGALKINDSLSVTQPVVAYSIPNRGLSLKYTIPIGGNRYIVVGESGNGTSTWTYVGLVNGSFNTIWGRLYGAGDNEFDWIGPLVMNNDKYYDLIGTYKDPSGNIYLDAIQIDSLGRLNCINLFRDANVSDSNVSIQRSSAALTPSTPTLNIQVVKVNSAPISVSTIARCNQ